MKLDLDGLEAFVVIAELSSFNRAAATLHISQSALSRRFKKMEEVTGVRLLERTTQRVELTQVGKAWLPLAQRLVMDLREAANKLGDAAHDWAGRASIACIPTAAAHFLPYAIAHYEKTHPSIQVRLLDSSSLGVIQAVADGSAEFGVGFFSRPETDLAFELLFDDHAGGGLPSRASPSAAPQCDLARTRKASRGPRWPAQRHQPADGHHAGANRRQAQVVSRG